eukprot:2919738-Rhodomonas_salina.1
MLRPSYAMCGTAIAYGIPAPVTCAPHPETPSFSRSPGPRGWGLDVRVSGEGWRVDDRPVPDTA